MREIIGLEEALAIVRREASGGRDRPEQGGRDGLERGRGDGLEPSGKPAPSQGVALDDALGRVLAREVVSPIDSPPFDKSAMDGFALAAGDTRTELTIRETVAAGGPSSRPLAPGECARIMTGAMLPPGADRVIRKEFVEERGGRVRIVRPEPGDNVVRRGANLLRGERVLGPKVLAAQDIGILAASGIAEVEAAVPPNVGIICTGPEIRPAGEALSEGQIYDSNGPQLAAQLAAMRCPARRRKTVVDEPGPLSAAIGAALRDDDVVILTGGVSEGDFDYVPRCLEEQGARILFHGVAVKPGKPTLFARRPGGAWVFGLPGNPVSTFVIFEVFVKPFLYGLMGLAWEAPVHTGILGDTVRRRQAERTEYLPVTFRGETVMPVAFHGSAHINALGAADGLIVMQRGVSELPRGARVDVRQI
jgi:molybdopterin molybdotransferase